MGKYNIIFQFKPATKNVIDRELVKEEFKLKDILKEYGSYSKSKTSHFKGDILAYVTPVSFIIKLSSISIYYVGLTKVIAVRFQLTQFQSKPDIHLNRKLM